MSAGAPGPGRRRPGDLVSVGDLVGAIADQLAPPVPPPDPEADRSSLKRRHGRLTTDVMLSRLSTPAKLLAAVLDWHAPNIRPSTERLMAILNCSERMVRYYRRELARFIVSGEVERAWWTERRQRRHRQRVAVEQQPLGGSLALSSGSGIRAELQKGCCSTATGCRPERVIPGPWGSWDDGDRTGVLFQDPGGDGTGWPEPPRREPT